MGRRGGSALGACLLLLGFVPACTRDAPGPSALGRSLRVAPAEHLVEGVWTWIAPTQRQRLHLTDFRDVRLVDERRETADGPWVATSHEARADFDVLWPAAAGAGVLALAGFDAEGALVVERWELRGAPAGDGPGVAGRAPFEITPLYRGPLGDGLHAVGFDHRGRYLLLLVRQGQSVALQRLENRPGAQPERLLDSGSQPELAAMRHLQQLRHARLGITWQLLASPLEELRILLVDGDDDGRLDGAPLVADAARMAELGLEDGADWRPLNGPD